MKKLFLAHSHLMLEETFLLTKERSAINYDRFYPADRSLFGSAFEVFLASGDVGVPQKSWEFHQWNLYIHRILSRTPARVFTV